MRFSITALILLICFSGVNAQMRILYGIKNNGEDVKNDSMTVYASKDILRIARPGLKKEIQFVDRKSGETIQLLEDGDDGYFSFKKNYETKLEGNEDGITEILGYPCIKRTLNIRSNKVEVWFTDMAENFGAPLLYLAEIPGLVLKVVRNGNFEIYAKEVKISDEYLKYAKLPEGKLIACDEADFQRRLIESRYVTQEIFKNEVLNFSNDLKADFSNDVIKAGKGSVVLKKVRIPKMTDNTIAIAEVTVRSNGDAYDRTGSLFAIPVKGKKNYLEAFEKGVEVLKEQGNKCRGMILTDDYEPPIELMRFMTSFGSGYFGKDVKIGGMEWKDSIVYRIEVTDLLKGLGSDNDVFIGAFIGNWDKGGHILSTRIKYFEEEGYNSKTGFVMPLFNTLSYLEMEGQGYENIFRGDTLGVKFRLPEGIKNAKLRFITSGHGDDEFTPRMHTILLDGKEVFKLTPWRTDCGCFRENNPASGNFQNGMSSSDYSRSNWCPGMVVNPYEITLEQINDNMHEIKVVIPSGENSYWNVSGCVTGE